MGTGMEGHNGVQGSTNRYSGYRGATGSCTVVQGPLPPVAEDFLAL